MQRRHAEVKWGARFIDEAMHPWGRWTVDRRVSITVPINDQVATLVIAQLLFLESTDPTRPIRIDVDSSGGVVTAALAIVDTMEHLRCPVDTMSVSDSYR